MFALWPTSSGPGVRLVATRLSFMKVRAALPPACVRPSCGLPGTSFAS
ncbi:hypothetical protein G6O69_22145 [Pseudenhygromyxa sp. WMMC2535]|nr:hypothetical protein [Pseudenhygromyxa sp. WMMC2535]